MTCLRCYYQFTTIFIIYPLLCTLTRAKNLTYFFLYHFVLIFIDYFKRCLFLNLISSFINYLLLTLGLNLPFSFQTSTIIFNVSFLPSVILVTTLVIIPTTTFFCSLYVIIILVIFAIALTLLFFYFFFLLTSPFFFCPFIYLNSFIILNYLII